MTHSDATGPLTRALAFRWLVTPGPKGNHRDLVTARPLLSGKPALPVVMVALGETKWAEARRQPYRPSRRPLAELRREMFDPVPIDDS
jgi:hypothetical protein